MSGFYKWLSSTKFQVGVLSIGLIYLSMELFKANPSVAIEAIRDIAVCYFGARILEPVVEFVTKNFEKKRGEK